MISKEKKYALQQVSKNSYSLALLSDCFRDDEDVVLAAVKKNGHSFQYASERIRTDKKIIKQMLFISENCFYRIDHDLRNSKEVIDIFIKSIKHNDRIDINLILRAIDEKIKNSEDFWMKLITELYWSISIPIEFRNNERVMLKAIIKNPENYRNCSDELQLKHEFINIVKHDVRTLLYGLSEENIKNTESLLHFLEVIMNNKNCRLTIHSFDVKNIIKRLCKNTDVKNIISENKIPYDGYNDGKNLIFNLYCEIKSIQLLKDMENTDSKREVKRLKF